MSDQKPDRAAMPYRDCVGIAVFNRQGQVFIGQRKLDDDTEHSATLGAPWQMPQGGIDTGEEPYAAALRELHEETNITSVTLLAQAPDWIYYDLPEAALGKALRGRYRGQRQRWFAFLFTGPETEIDVRTPAGGSCPAEFEHWRWDDLSHMPDLIVSFKRDAYRQVVQAFAHLPAQLRGK